MSRGSSLLLAPVSRGGASSPEADDDAGACGRGFIRPLSALATPTRGLVLPATAVTDGSDAPWSSFPGAPGG